MTHIDPFPGYRYAVATGDELAVRLCPPYDRIPSEIHDHYCNLHPLNAVHLILPPPDHSGIDTMTQASSNLSWHQEAARRFQEWIAKGEIRPDEPSIYLYRQAFNIDGIDYIRWGFFAALRLDPGERALAHEKTFEGPKADRFRLMSACKANMSSIFVLYDDSKDAFQNIIADLPDDSISCKTDDGNEHALFALRDPAKIAELQQMMSSQQVYIADGHHRYETSIRYLESLCQEGDVDKAHPANWTLAFFCAIQDPGLRILATHRLVRDLPSDWQTRLDSGLPEGWSSRIVSNAGECAQTLRECPESSVAIIVSDGEHHRLLTADRETCAASLNDCPDALRRLEVIALHEILLSRVLGITDPKEGQIRYIKTLDKILDLAAEENRKSGSRTNAAFLLRPVKVEEVRNASAAGCRMPPKSTDFFPKLPTGLVFRRLEA